MIDLTKLKRDYKNSPLKRGEYPEIEDVKYLFIDCGLSRKETAQICNCAEEKVKIVCRKYKLLKTKDQKTELRKRTTMQKYGVENISQLKEIKEKKKQTCLKHYGVDNPAKSDIVYDKIHETSLDRYGVDSPNKSIQKKEKIKRILLQKYGVENVMQIPEIYKKNEDSKRNNGTLNTSKPEKEILLLLQYLFKEVKHPYKSKLYPFKCDFYIPELDLYIEFQGSWTHGYMPFELTNEKCIQQYKQWTEKAKTSEYYQNALNVWTIRDVIKRKTAKENNLNYLEFFTMNDFMEWYKEICEI